MKSNKILTDRQTDRQTDRHSLVESKSCVKPKNAVEIC